MLNNSSTLTVKSSPTGIRSSVWEGAVPLCITVDTSELSAGADRGMEAYYVSAPRLSYLSLLLPTIKANFLSLVLDESAFLSLSEANVWFEHQASGTALRWHWPIGLLYDTLVASSTPTLDLPLQISLRLSPAPIDKLLLQNNVAACRDAFMNQIKEADFVRWGSTRRVTNLRQREAEALWEGLSEHDFDKFWTVASKLVPAPPAPHSVSSAPLPTAPPAASTMDRMPDGNGVRHVPLRVYLPHGAPVMQGNIGPVGADGRPTTLYAALSSLVPLLFPTPTPKRRLARPLIQGTMVPTEAELGWLGTVMCGADGWLSIVVVLER